MRKRISWVLYLVLTAPIIIILLISSPVLAQTISLSQTSGPVGTGVSAAGAGFTANAAFFTG